MLLNALSFLFLAAIVGASSLQQQAPNLVPLVPIAPEVFSPPPEGNSSNTTTTSTDTSAPLVPTQIVQPEQIAQVKFVFAHFMVGNTHPYKVTDWVGEMKLAASKNIDAFVLNVGRDDWQPARVADAFVAAASTNFKLFFSFDMTSLPCESDADGDTIRRYLRTHAAHPNYFHYGGRPLVSTFSGQDCRFGMNSADQGWTKIVKNFMTGVTFVPSFFIDPATYRNYKSFDGAFEWNNAWPMADSDITFDRDRYTLSNLNGRVYMAAVSPWFFAHYGATSWNKNFIYRSDNWLLAQRWEQIIENRHSVDLAEIITWNDYGESHYVGPVTGDQPMSEAWVNGFDHTGWLDLITYYIAAFKTGKYSVHRDRVFLWGRLYPKNADAPDPVGRPERSNWAEDNLYAVVLMTLPAQVTLTCGRTSQTTAVGIGHTKLKLPLFETCDVSAIVTRASVPVLTFKPKGYRFNTVPPSYNFNAFVAASP